MHLRSPTGNKPSPQPRPSVLTHRLTGDRWRPGAPPAGRPTAWPAARLPAAWPGSGAPSDTAEPRRWSGRTRSRVRSKCKGCSSISRGPTDRHPEEAGRARSQLAVLRPLGRQRGEGSAAAGPPLMASSGVLGTADLARPRGASKGGEPAPRPPPLLSLPPPSFPWRCCVCPGRRAEYYPSLASLKSDEEGTVAQNRATSPPHSSQTWPNSPRALGSAVWASARGEALRPPLGLSRLQSRCLGLPLRKERGCREETLKWAVWVVSRGNG